MKPNEAYSALGLQPGATRDAVRSAYNERYTDYQIRLTNAPTPELKRVYQRNLQELRAAMDVLAPGESGDASQDLPAAQPTLGTAPPARPAPARAAAKPESTPAAKAADGPSKATAAALVLAILCAGAASFFALRWYRLHDEAPKAAAAAERAVQERTAMAARLDLTKNGTFKVCNRSDERVFVKWVAASYWKGDHLETFNSALCEAGPWPVPPGGSGVAITVDRGRCQWDGEVAFFAVQIQLHDGSEYHVAGTWSDVRKDCAKVAE